MSRILVIARRELAGFFYAPIAYVVGVLFLALQGFSFWSVVRVLADPDQPAGYGAVLHTHFGGTLLYWAVLFAVVAVVSMRLVAEDKRQGTWEALLTTRASEEEVVLGKWLGGLAFYAFLWLPTLSFLAVLEIYAPPGASIDPGPVFAAYLGVLCAGAAFLALGLAASSATSNQIIAATATFSVAIGILFFGQLTEIGGGWIEEAPSLAAVSEFADVRAHMDRFSRGAVESEALVFYLGLTLFGLAAAGAASAAGRRRPRELRRRALAVSLVAAIAIFASLLVAAHPLTWDLSRARVNTLDERTERVLARIEEPTRVLVVRPQSEGFAPVYREVDRLLGRMIREQPLLERRSLDPALEPERVERLAQEFALSPDDLASGGAVVFRRGERRRAVDLLAMADFTRDDLGVGAIGRFRAEEAFAGALAELSLRDRPLVCATSRHGELPLAASGARPHLGALASRLERDGYALEEVGALAGGVSEACDVLLVAGPRRALSADEALAVEAHLGRGGAVFVALAGRAEDPEGRPRLPKTGLETVLAERGLRFPRAVVLDPQNEIELPLAWITASGYGDHPISAPFQGRRVTVWLAPRPVLGGEPLVRPSPAGWGETNLGALFSGAPVSAGAEDLLGAPAVAAAAEDEDTGARVVVFGSARSLSSELADRGLGGAGALATSAFAWLTGRSGGVDIGEKTPEHVRLIMTGAQLRGVFVFCVIVLPLALALLGGVVWWRRRRA